MRYIISLMLTSTLVTALPASADVPKVMTDITPIHALTAQVMGELGTPDLLLEQGGDAHDFQLRPSQAQNLAKADLVIWVGPEMTPWLERALESLAPDATQLGLLALPQTYRQDFAAAPETEDHHGHDHDHAHDHGHDHGHDHSHDHGHDHGHDHSSLDPHAWLDPENAKLWVAAIAASLSEIDPENAATYAANAKTAAQNIQSLDAELQATLAPVRGAAFATFHDAYGYFTAHYGLTSVGSVNAGDAAAPGAAHLRALETQLKSDQPRCLFPEAQHDPRQIARLGESTQIKIGAPLDPEGSLLEPGPGAYENLMRDLARNLASCLGA